MKTWNQLDNSHFIRVAIKMSAKILANYSVGKLVSCLGLENEVANNILKEFGANVPIDKAFEYIMDNVIPDSIDNVRKEYNSAAGIDNE